MENSNNIKNEKQENEKKSKQRYFIEKKISIKCMKQFCVKIKKFLENQ
jgi:hypothetical protein